MHKPKPQTFLETFAEVTETDPQQVTLETRLNDIPGWDSLSMVMFLGTVDAEYDTQLDGTDVARADTIEDLYNLVIGH